MRKNESNKWTHRRTRIQGTRALALRRRASRDRVAREESFFFFYRSRPQPRPSRSTRACQVHSALIAERNCVLRCWKVNLHSGFTAGRITASARRDRRPKSSLEISAREQESQEREGEEFRADDPTISPASFSRGKLSLSRMLPRSFRCPQGRKLALSTSFACYYVASLGGILVNPFTG